VAAAPEESVDDSAKDSASTSKPVAKSKLQLKMEAAKLRKQEAEAQKKEADGAAGEAAPSPESNADAKSSVSSAPEATPLSSATPPEAKAKVPVPTREEQKKRVFNMGDEGWQDASIPGSAAAGDDGSSSDIGPDGKKLSKKELKKVQRDREIRQKEQVRVTSSPLVYPTLVLFSERTLKSCVRRKLTWVIALRCYSFPLAFAGNA
jgi:hypothetical protein